MLKSFVVVIPSFNNAPWYRKNLDSVLEQQYPNFRVIYLDDASPDETGRLVEEYIAASRHAHRIEFHRNETRVGPVDNIDRAVRSCDPNDIIVLVDGDDFLVHRQVLTRLNTIYQDPNVWITWGQFVRYPQGGGGFCDAIPPEIVSANAFRDYPFVSSHLRTFYAGLYQRVRPIDVQDCNGRFFTIAGDVAQMFAMMEMAGEHGKFVPEVLYEYNRANPINDDKVDRAGQVRTELSIREKARYGRLRSLSDPQGPREVYVGSGMGRSLFEGMASTAELDDRRRPFRQLRTVLNRLGYTIRESQTLSDVEDPHAIVVFDVRPDEVERLAQFPRELLTLVLWKDPIAAPSNFDARCHERFQRIYTWNSDLVDDERYHRISYPYLRPMIDDVVPFENRKLCALMASNRAVDHPDQLYSAERDVAAYFSTAEYDSFDLYGWGWDPALHPNYRGVFLKKAERLRRYRFSFCYETVKGWNGFVTNKIFDSFEAGCVPIYWGAPDVADFIPKNCFIAREDFRSDAELRDFLRDMTAVTFERYVERIRGFLKSRQALTYSASHFVSTFVTLLGGRSAARSAEGAAATSMNGVASGTPT